jgi:hypothetical protein
MDSKKITVAIDVDLAGIETILRSQLTEIIREHMQNWHVKEKIKEDIKIVLSKAAVDSMVVEELHNVDAIRFQVREELTRELRRRLKKLITEE